MLVWFALVTIPNFKVQAVFNDNLLGYFDFDEQSGFCSPNVTNNVSSSSIFTCNDITRTSTDVNVNKYSGIFNGISSYVTTLDTRFNLSDKDFTVSMWVFVDTSASQVLYSKHNAAGNQRSFQLYIDSVNDDITLIASGNGTTVVTVTTTVNVNTNSLQGWHLITAWHDSTLNTINVKFDDYPTSSVSHTAGLFNNNSTVTIGMGSNLLVGYAGNIDNVYIWDRVLTSSEISLLFSQGSGYSYVFPVCSTDLDCQQLQVSIDSKIHAIIYTLLVGFFLYTFIWIYSLFVKFFHITSWG